MTLVDFNAFLIKLYLWIPTEHWFNIARMVLFYIMGIPTVRQYYFYVTDRKCKRLGSQSFVFMALLILELALIYKTSYNIPPAPTENKIAWVCAIFLYLVGTFIICKKF